MRASSIYFFLFCFLITFRDTFTQLMLSRQAKTSLTPMLVLCVYCWTSTFLAWCFWSMRNRKINAAARWNQLSSSQQLNFIKLGFATWLVYMTTVWGIALIGAPVFNVIDYAGMPLITVFAGNLFLAEKLQPQRIIFAIVGIFGVCILFVASPQVAATDDHGFSRLWWYSGIACALLSTLATSYSSALQKRQITVESLYADEVLLFRFPIPATITTVILIIVGVPSISSSQIVALAIVAAVGVFLPLLLLCFGFITASLGQFSRFLLLIPLLTWIVVPVMVRGELQKLTNPWILVGTAILLSAFLVSEVLEASSGRAASKADADKSAEPNSQSA